MRFHYNSMIPLFLISCLAYLFIFTVMNKGPGVSPDSLVYFDTAENIISGKGFQANNSPLINFPPVYPLLLAGAGCLGGEVLNASRVLHAFFFAATIGMLGLAAYLSSGNKLMPMLIAVSIALISVQINAVFVMAWSEPPFILFCLITYTCFLKYIREQKLSFLLYAAVSLGTVMMTRYVGVTILLSFLIFFGFLDNRSLLNRLRDMVILFLISLIPLMLWFVRNSVLAGSATNRNFAVHPVTWHHIDQIIELFYKFWFPVNAPWIKYPFIIIFSGFLIYAVTMCKRRGVEQVNHSGGQHHHQLLLTICASYIIFLLFSISFFDAHTPINYRLLSPFFIFFILLVVSISWDTAYTKRKILWKFFLVFLCGSLWLNATSTASLMGQTYFHGRGYTEKGWRESKTIAYLKTLSENVKIYSNGADVIRFLTDHHAEMIPSEVNPTSLLKNREFDEKMRTVIENIKDEKAILVFHYFITHRWYMPTAEKLEQVFDLPVRVRFSDGIVFGGTES